MASCSCGKCIAGVLSPRAAFRLSQCATNSAELVKDSMPDFGGERAVHDPQVMLLDFCPPELRLEVTEPFIVGFANCMASAAYLLKQGQLPKPRMVAQCASIVPGLDKSATKDFLERGGLPEYALDAVLARCVEEHETLGDGSFLADEANAARIEALPACSNDNKLELVRARLFENSDFWPMGPYGFDDAGVEDEYVYYDQSAYMPAAAYRR